MREEGKIRAVHHARETDELATAELGRNDLRREPGLTVGDNEPYAMSGIDHTVPRHAYPARRYVEFEVRQDLIVTPAGQADWADRLARILGVAHAAGA